VANNQTGLRIAAIEEHEGGSTHDNLQDARYRCYSLAANDQLAIDGTYG
jgi:hypothetical protein